jgi:hypothetical protein
MIRTLITKLTQREFAIFLVFTVISVITRIVDINIDVRFLEERKYKMNGSTNIHAHSESN